MKKKIIIQQQKEKIFEIAVDRNENNQLRKEGRKMRREKMKKIDKNRKKEQYNKGTNLYAERK